MHNNILRICLFYLLVITCNSSKKENKQNYTPSAMPIPTNNIPTCQNCNYPVPHHNVPHSMPIQLNTNANILLYPLSRSPTCQNMHR